MDSKTAFHCPKCQSITQLDAEQTQTTGIAACGSCQGLFEAPPINTGDVTQSLAKALTWGDRFEARGILGSGGFSEVYRAWDHKLKRYVAVKIPKSSFTHGDKELFLREARAAARLKHPHIVIVHDVGETDKHTYIVSDMIEGGSLRDWLQKHRPTPQKAAEICEKIADALDHAHRQGIVHRDIKPGNVMLNLEEKPFLADFGLARNLYVGEKTLSKGGALIGTLAYMSPEQVEGPADLLDGRSDIFSLGVVLYEMLAGKRPFDGPSGVVIGKILTETPSAIRLSNTMVPLDLDKICSRAMTKNPEDRYQSAGEMRDDLRRFLEGKPVLANPTSRLNRTWRLARRHPWISTIAASSLLILTLSVMVFLLSGGKGGGIELQSVTVATTPVGAKLQFFPVGLSMLPDPAADPTYSIGGQAVELAAGRYLVVAMTPEGDFAEVIREVPAAPATGSRRTPSKSGNEQSAVELTPINIVPIEKATQGMVLIRGGSFATTVQQQYAIEGLRETLRDYYIDPNEVTWLQYAETLVQFNPRMQGPPGDPVSGITHGDALLYAEATGKSLPIFEELTFAASNRGSTKFPWGNEPLPEHPSWEYGSSQHRGWDLTQSTDRPILGLYSGVGEWTLNLRLDRTMNDSGTPVQASQSVSNTRSSLQDFLTTMRGAALVEPTSDGNVPHRYEVPPHPVDNSQMFLALAGDKRVGIRCVRRTRPLYWRD